MERILLGIVGFAAAGAGAVATFIDGTNVGGAPLLIGVGALFSYLALSGQRIKTFEAGGTKADLSSRRALERVIKSPDLSEEAKREVAVATEIEEVPLTGEARREVRRILSAGEIASDYEKAVRAVITNIRPDLVSSRPLLRQQALDEQGLAERLIPVVWDDAGDESELKSALNRLLPPV